MVEAILKSIKLDNAAQLELIDGSRQVAADRWLVRLNIRLTVPVSVSTLGPADVAGVSLDEIRAELGDTVVFEQQKDRNFIDAGEKDAVLTGLYDAFMTTAAGYLAHPLFPQKLILKKYKDHLVKKDLQAQMTD